MKNFLFIFLVCLLFSSCREKDKVDVMIPVITSVMLNDSTSTLHLINAPSNNTLQVSVSDNMGLNQLKLVISPVDYANANSSYGPNSGEYDQTEIVNLSGTSATNNFAIDLPDSIAGNWLVTVDLSDEVGYLATTYTAIMQVENDNLPTITATTIPAITNGAINMSEGSNLDLSGTVFDSDSLDFVQVRLESLSGTALTSTDIPFDDTGISFTPSFDDMQEGNYMLVIEGRDKLGYRRVWGVHVNVN